MIFLCQDLSKRILYRWIFLFRMFQSIYNFTSKTVIQFITTREATYVTLFFSGSGIHGKSPKQTF